MNMYLNRSSKYLLLSFFILGIFVSSLISQTKSCDPIPEERKIEILLKKIGNFEGSFIRNGDAHEAKEAENHLRYKLKEAKNSFFAPDPKEWTAKLFIEKIATKSFLSGTPYKIRYPNGKEVLSSTWLNEELRNIERCP
ncbi:hypothetical protein LEP1GSC202_0631 [Leptospira yanagawae serovar Saopaulo str. Sao Paulo = ATCC 700523]|uniref:Uncharacterized protein n=1 Tax=Leptospira yanagawae serovar Saopaulo str. Sao Paulo = ATCC 700523 TaxID=1249483 RepID=A0A5E8HG76_9LEPT|nr:DUF5329 family protein [Leptospira yanagawae]EOQ90249.1 hypothetical protein LEP1GSC202_0631 [Leptospira yanagawae serovar Saopaulo str. Sao Paulo = ATCC 700523]